MYYCQPALKDRQDTKIIFRQTCPIGMAPRLYRIDDGMPRPFVDDNLQNMRYRWMLLCQLNHVNSRTYSLTELLRLDQ